MNDYDALRDYLMRQKQAEFVLSFEQIEEIIGAALPRAARGLGTFELRAVSSLFFQPVTTWARPAASAGHVCATTSSHVMLMRSGALPASLTYLEERTIGPSLGADAIRSGVIASLVGLLLIVLFMFVYYRFSGVNAVVALLFNLIILLGLMAYIGAVMTLPGCRLGVE